MGFDNGNNERAAISQQAPDFSASLNAYHGQVKDIGVRIKAANEELAAVLDKLEDATAKLHEQYAQRVDSLGTEVNDLLIKVAELRALKTSLDSQIAEKQAAKDSISLDNEAEQKRLDDEWTALHKSSGEVTEAQRVNEASAKALIADSVKLKAEEEGFVAYKKAELYDLDKKIEVLMVLETAVNQKQNEVANLVQQSNDLLIKIEQEKADLAAKLNEATVVLAQADEVNKQTLANAEALKINSAQASVNDRNMKEIKVARVALHNKEQELKAREQMVSLAERKIGG